MHARRTRRWSSITSSWRSYRPRPVPPQLRSRLRLAPRRDRGKAEPAGKDADIEALRKELQEIKKQLAEQEAERARSQPKNTVPEKVALLASLLLSPFFQFAGKQHCFGNLRIDFRKSMLCR